MRQPPTHQDGRFPRELSRVASLAVGAVMVFMLLAGAAKLHDVPAFAQALATWEWLPIGFVQLLAIIVPTLEVLIAGCWILRIWRPLALRAAFALLAAFTGFYALHLATAEPPDCGCLGRLLAHSDSLSSAWWVLVRNSLLMGVLAFALIRTRATGRATDPRSGSVHPLSPANAANPSDTAEARQTPRGHPAFTLIETIIVIAMVATLVAMILPSLGRVKLKAQETVSLGNLRSHAQVFSVYTNDWKGIYPYFTAPDATATVFYPDGNPIAIEYFDAHAFWNLALAPDYYGGNYRHPSFFPPGEIGGYPMCYLYPCTFITDPRYWNHETRTGPSQRRPTGAHEVLFPSAKVLLSATGDCYDQGVYVPYDPKNPPDYVKPSDPRLVALTDGGARNVRYGAFTRGYDRGDGPGGFHVNSSPAGMHTIDGVRGRDFH